LAVQTIEFDEGAGAVLRIQPLRAPRDENTYECVARNSEGEVSVTAKLSIIRGKSQKHTYTCICLRHAFSSHVHTLPLPSFMGLSVIDVTIEQHHTLPAKQAAVNCSFYSPSECGQA